MQNFENTATGSKTVNQRRSSIQKNLGYLLKTNLKVTTQVAKKRPPML
jgi:hypothetical protein